MEKVYARRYDYLKILAGIISPEDLVVCNLQDTTYEWNAIRPSDGNILRMGLGLVVPVALGIALALPHRKVVALAGDGDLILNIGVLTTIGNLSPNNLTVIVFDNECYMSAGGIPTATAGKTDLTAIAKGSGIENSHTVETLDEFKSVVERYYGKELLFVTAKTEKSTLQLERPTMDGDENKFRFVRFIEKTEGIKILTPDEAPSFFVKKSA
jgi:thiamine pyrophosphate-dependent acetolactate synthase large subunit-like protein